MALRFLKEACRPARFLILGSASPDIVKGVSESLAGRVGFVNLAGFHAGEIKAADHDDLWLRGGFPRSFLSASDAASVRGVPISSARS